MPVGGTGSCVLHILVILELCGAALGRGVYKSECPSAASDSWIDMSSWLSAGTQSRWEVKDGGRTLKQYVNTVNPGFYVSDNDEIIDVVIKGTIVVEDQTYADGSCCVAQDNDFIGVMLGLHDPLPWTLSHYDGMLFSWGGAIQTDLPHHSFFALHKLNGTIPLEPPNRGHCSGAQGHCFWWRFDYRDAPGKCPSGMCYGQQVDICDQGIREAHGCYHVGDASSEGWETGQMYSFAILFTEDVLAVAINGQIKLKKTQEAVLNSCLELAKLNATATENCKYRDKKAWRKGRIAWYNLSQHGVTYGNVRKFDVTKKRGPTPEASEDIYGVNRQSGGFLEKKELFYTGLLANDWSPTLLTLEAVLPAVYGGDIDKTAATPNKRQTCEHGSILQVEEMGAFTYTPHPELITKADQGNVYLEMCDYFVKDSRGEWSERTNITFALEPKSMVCPPEGCFDVTWEPVEYEHEWYGNIERDAVFGELVANGSCVRIVDWLLPNGGVEGRFSLKGNKIVASRPEDIKAKFLERVVYKMLVRAIDIFGQSGETHATVVIPAECEVQGKCICNDGSYGAYDPDLPRGCQCNERWTGPMCSECAQNYYTANCSVFCDPKLTCNGLGTCNSNGTCDCVAPFKGDCLECIEPFYPPGDCTQECSRDLNCSGNGICALDRRGTPAKCECDDGWAGPWLVDGCNVQCTGDACSGHGQCIDDDQEACHCDRKGEGNATGSFAGRECELCAPDYYPAGRCDTYCSPTATCRNRGECSDEGTCICNSPTPGGGNWTGDECTKCAEGWYPPWACNIPCSRELNCSGNGRCAPDATCFCDDQYRGPDCSYCAAYWYPSESGDCDIYCASETTCSDHGACSANGTCACDPGYYGEACDVFCSRPKTCNGNGDCDDEGDCMCDERFQGDHCAECAENWYPVWVCDTYCTDNGTCSGHGVCSLSDGSCQCADSWSGDDCSHAPTVTLPDAIGAAENEEDDSGCVFFEVGGMCLGWLVLLLILFALCLICLALYLLFKPKKKKRRFQEGTDDALLRSHDTMGGWEGGDLNGMDPHKKQETDVEGVNFGPADTDGMDPNGLNQPPSNENTMTFGPASLSGMDPNSLKQPPGAGEEGVVGPDFGPASISGMDPNSIKQPPSAGANAAGDPNHVNSPISSAAPEFGPADLGGMGPLDARKPNRDFGPADLGGMDPLAKKSSTPTSFGYGPGALNGMNALHRDAVLKGGLAAAVEAELPRLNDQELEKAKKEHDEATKNLEDLLRKEAEAGRIPQHLNDPFAGGWGPADMSGMDPMVGKALQKGKVAAVADAMARSDAHSGLGAAVAAWREAGAKLRGAALGAAGRAQDGEAQQLYGAMGLPATEQEREAHSLATLSSPTHLHAALTGRIPAAAKEALGTCGGAAEMLKAPLKDFDKRQASLEKALRDTASAAPTPDDVKDKIGQVLAGTWGPADMDGMGPLGAALREGAFAAVAREVLRTPGVPKRQRQKLDDALRNNDRARAGVVSAATGALANTSLPESAKETLRKAFGDKSALGDRLRSGLDHGMVREAASRGRLFEQAAAKPAAAEALKAAEAADAALREAVAGLREGDGKSYLAGLLGAGGNAWGPPDDMSGMEAKALERGKAAAAVRHALRRGVVAGGGLEAALAAADAAAAQVADAVHGKQTVQLDALQRDAAARGRVAADVQQRTNLSDDLQTRLVMLGAAEQRLVAAVRTAAADTTLPEAARKVLRDAADDNCWGPAGDLAGLEPLTRAALSRGHAAAAAAAVLRQPDVPPSVQAMLEPSLRTFEQESAKLQAAAGSPPAQRSPWEGWDGNVALDMMQPLHRALMKGALPAAVAAVLQRTPHYELQTGLAGVEQAERELAAVVRSELPNLPADARAALQKALEGSLAFEYGGVDMSGMEPGRGLLEQVVRGVLAKDVRSPAMEAAADKLAGQTASLAGAVRHAIDTPHDLQPTAREQLQDALYGRTRLDAQAFTGQGIDLASDDFAPLMQAGGTQGSDSSNLKKNWKQVEQVAAHRAAAAAPLLGGGVKGLLGGSGLMPAASKPGISPLLGARSPAPSPASSLLGAPPALKKDASPSKTVAL